MRKQKRMRWVSLLLITAMVAGASGSVALAWNHPAAAERETATAKNKEVLDKLKTVVDGERAVGKEETVYVLASADGTANKIIVSDWLKNPEKVETLLDETTLTDVQNVKGDETFTAGDGNAYQWAAGGQDIYYQGVSEKSLPVTVAIGYTLDGKPVTAEELAGKSGRVSMRFTYTNHEKQNGKYVPFLMATGMVLDNEKFTNVEVTNGKLINDGDRSMVLGFALPGLQENLEIDKETLTLPDFVEVSADVTDFSLMTTLTLATNEVFNGLNLDEVDSLDGLQEALKEMQDAALQLVDGSSTLFDGLSTLYSKSGELVNGINQLADGAEQLTGGSSTLQSGAAELNGGISELNSGLEELTKNSDSLNGGAKQVFESLLSMADRQLAAAGLKAPKLTIDNYKQTLDGVLGSLDKDAVYQMAYKAAKEKVTAAVQAQEPAIRAQVEAVVHDQVLEAVLAATGNSMTATEYAQAVAAGMIPEEMQLQISSAVDSQMNSEEIQSKITGATGAKITELIEANMQSSDVQAQIEAAVSQAAAGAGSIQVLVAQLDSYKEFYSGVLAYTAGVGTAKDGSQKLLDGSNQLKDGAATLAGGAAELQNGISALQSGSGALVDGVKELRDGASKLRDGMQEFNEEGVEKLVNALDGDLDGLLTRLKDTVNASKSYQSFAGKRSDTEGSVKFIYRTESIGE